MFAPLVQIIDVQPYFIDRARCKWCGLWIPEGDCCGDESCVDAILGEIQLVSTDYFIVNRRED